MMLKKAECWPTWNRFRRAKDQRINMPVPRRSRVAQSRSLFTEPKSELLEALEDWSSVAEEPACFHLPRYSVRAMRIARAARAIEGLTEATRKKCGGVPVLKGTRFPLSQLIAELADGKSVKAIAKGFELDEDHIIELLHALAVCLDLPIAK